MPQYTRARPSVMGPAWGPQIPKNLGCTPHHGEQNTAASWQDKAKFTQWFKTWAKLGGFALYLPCSLEDP